MGGEAIMPDVDYPVLVRSKTKFGRFVRLLCTKLDDSPYSVDVCQLITTEPQVYSVVKTSAFDDFKTAIDAYVADTTEIFGTRKRRAEAYVKTQTIAERIAISRELKQGGRQ